MTLLAPLVSALLLTADAPGAVVVVSRRTAISAAEAQALAMACSARFRDAGVPIAMEPDVALKQLARVSVKDTATCAGRRACLAELGRQLKVGFVVGLSAASLDKDTSLGLELIRVADETVVEKDSLLLPRRGKPGAELLAGFSARVKAVLAPEPVKPAEPPKKPDAPKVVSLLPDEPPPPPPPTEPPPRGHSTSYVLGGAGVAALAAGAALLALGLSSRSRLEQGTAGADGRARSELTGAEAQATNSSSSLMLGAAAGALAVGAGLGTAAVVTW